MCVFLLFSGPKSGRLPPTRANLGGTSATRPRIWTRSYHPNAQVLMPGCARTAGPYQCATSASLKLHGRVFFCDVHLGSREVAGPASRTRRLGAACAAARTHTLSQDIVIQAHYHIGAARRTCSIARACERAHMMGGATEQKRRAFAGGPARRASARTGSGMMLEDAARGGSCLWTAWGCVAPRTPNRGTRTQHCPRVFRAHEKSSICAHIGPKDGDNSKPGPTCAVPPISLRAPMTEGAQRSAHRADRSKHAPAQVGHACGELPTVRLGPPDASNHANGSVS